MNSLHVNRMNALAPDRMTAAERLKEISELLAAALLRRRTILAAR
jgi:hypothetical protein